MIDILVQLAILVVSLAFLLFFADKLIDHAIKLARILGVSGTVIGLTLLAYGTSLPEFSVSTIASLYSHSDLAVSNIVGSSIYNIAIIMGITSIFVSLKLFSHKEKGRPWHGLRREWLFDGGMMMFSTLLLVALAFSGGISRPWGFVMLVAMGLFLYFILKKERNGERQPRHKGHPLVQLSYCVFFLMAVLATGYFTVNSAASLARLAGLSEWLIGATIVAAGTSLPETVVSIFSARKGQMGMSVGNIVGSNLFNIMAILGAASVISPLSINPGKIWIDLGFLLLITSMFFLQLLRGKITRTEGVVYVFLYALYVIHLLGFF